MSYETGVGKPPELSGRQDLGIWQYLAVVLEYVQLNSSNLFSDMSLSCNFVSLNLFLVMLWALY